MFLCSDTTLSENPLLSLSPFVTNLGYPPPHSPSGVIFKWPLQVNKNCRERAFFESQQVVKILKKFSKCSSESPRNKYSCVGTVLLETKRFYHGFFPSYFLQVPQHRHQQQRNLSVKANKIFAIHAPTFKGRSLPVDQVLVLIVNIY